jgi:hypothetical protein
LASKEVAAIGTRYPTPAIATLHDSSKIDLSLEEAAKKAKSTLTVASLDKDMRDTQRSHNLLARALIPAWHYVEQSLAALEATPQPSQEDDAPAPPPLLPVILALQQAQTAMFDAILLNRHQLATLEGLRRSYAADALLFPDSAKGRLREFPSSDSSSLFGDKILTVIKEASEKKASDALITLATTSTRVLQARSAPRPQQPNQNARPRNKFTPRPQGPGQFQQNRGKPNNPRRNNPVPRANFQQGSSPTPTE